MDKSIWIPRDEWEQNLLELVLNEFGEYCSVSKLCKVTSVGKDTIYNCIRSGDIAALKFKNKNFVLTRSLLPFFREREYRQ